jgi:hypothetical protein
MDHDADHTHLNKLRTFRDDFLTLSDLTMDQFHEMAERRRRGEPLGDLVPDRDRPAPMDTGIEGRVEALEGEFRLIAPSAGVLAWLQANQGALEGLIAGSQAAAHAITDAEGADGASQGEKPPASLPEGEAEPLGTDKSTGDVHRDGEPLETTTVDAGTEALPAGQLPKE